MLQSTLNQNYVLDSIIVDPMFVLPTLIILWASAKLYVALNKFWLTWSLTGLLLPAIIVYSLLSILNPNYAGNSIIFFGWPYIIAGWALTSLAIGCLMRHKVTITQKLCVPHTLSKRLKIISLFILLFVFFVPLMGGEPLLDALVAFLSLCLLCYVSVQIYQRLRGLWIVAWFVSTASLLGIEVMLMFMLAYFVNPLYLIAIYGGIYFMLSSLLISTIIGIIVHFNKPICTIGKTLCTKSVGRLTIETKLFLLMLLLLLSYYA